jgi:hypothetical protein
MLMPIACESAVYAEWGYEIAKQLRDAAEVIRGFYFPVPKEQMTFLS